MFALIVVKFLAQVGQPSHYEVFECDSQKALDNKRVALHQEFISTGFDHDKIKLTVVKVNDISVIDYEKDVETKVHKITTIDGQKATGF